MRREIAALAAALSLLLTGCGDRLLERSWSSVTSHSAGYWENGEKDTLRADSYQDLVNALLLLVANREESGFVRVYVSAEQDMAQLSADACAEVQHETDLGAYLLDYITYAGEQKSDCYELSLSFGYRRTSAEQQSMINATSSEAIPDLLRAAAEESAERLTVRIAYFSTDRAGVKEMVRAVQTELSPEGEAPTEPWTVLFYPDSEEMGIVEVLLQ